MHRFASSAALVLLTSLLATGCDSSTGPSDWLAVSIQGTSFERGEDDIASIPWEIVNEGSRTLSIATCGDWPAAVVDRLENGSWRQYSGAMCIAHLAIAPVELEPGERLEGSRALNEPGIYRLRFGVTDGAGGEVDWGAASRAFEVE